MGREKGLQRYLGIYLAKLKKAAQAETREENSTINMTTSWLLSACKYPRTLSFAGERNPPSRHDGGGGSGGDTSATLADVDRFLFDNFNSLYDARDEDDDDGGTSNALAEGVRVSATSTSSSSFTASASSSTATLTQPPPKSSDVALLAGHSVAVMTLSKDPYGDFRRSLQEMVDARHQELRDPLDWDFMEELLISYLELNDRAVHKHIIHAFTDVAVSARRHYCGSVKSAEEAETGGRRRRRRGAGRALTSPLSTEPTDGNPASLTCK